MFQEPPLFSGQEEQQVARTKIRIMFKSCPREHQKKYLVSCLGKGRIRNDEPMGEDLNSELERIGNGGILML